MRILSTALVAAAALAGTAVVATPAAARTFVSVGIGAPVYPAYPVYYGGYYPAYYGGYYPAYYPGYYAPYYGGGVVVGGWYGGRHYYWGPHRGYYGRGWHRGWHGHGR